MSEPIFEINAYNAKTKRFSARLHPSARSEGGPSYWPLARIGNRDPMVLAEYATKERRGADLGYAVAPFDSELFVPVYAAQAGEVSFALEGADGFAVTLDHGDYTTHYEHLSKMFVTRCLPKLRRRQYVRAGYVIGYAAKAPQHVRFELWQWTDDRGLVAVDPVPFLSESRNVLPDSGLRTRATMNPNEAA